jgi:tRNA wybutosine-synthesizing protein 3
LKDKWSLYKESVLKRIIEDSIIGYLDPGILGILVDMNSLQGLATTSSCSGRITLVEGDRHWDRSSSRIVYKAHVRVEPGDLYRVISRPFPSLWLKVSGPIIHVRTESLECALHLLEKARRHGFKHSGIVSIKPGEEGGVVVELMSSIDVAIPVRIRNRELLRGEEAAGMADLFNSFLEEGRRRLESLAKDLVSDPGPCGPASFYASKHRNNA